MQVALRIGDLDTGSGEMFIDQVIQVTSEPARAVTHFATPGNEIEINCAIAKFFEKSRQLRIVQGGSVLTRCGDQGLTHLIHVVDQAKNGYVMAAEVK